MYKLYHIPGKKIGVTRNLKKRVTDQQGYYPGEYEVLFTSEDIDFISNKEIELQKSYGYTVDRQTYKNLIKPNKMKINVTEQTTTFPVPVSKLKGRLSDMVGFSWATSNGNFTITPESIDFIMNNSYSSMFNKNRSFVYNKALANYFNPEASNNTLISKPQVKKLKIFKNIRKWAKERGLYDKGNSNTQYIKLMEEAGELAQALLKRDEPEIRDAIGDMVVVLTNLAHLEGVTIEECLYGAYDEISNRKGEMINGTFVKQTL